MRWAGHVAHVGDSRGAYRVLVGRPEGKRPLVTPRCRWEDIIKIDLQAVGWGGMEWTDLTENRDMWQVLVNVVMNLWVP